MSSSKAASSASSYSLINELNTTKKDGKLKIRVSRLWEVLNYKDNDSLISIDMVLIDEEGDYVHATIKGEYAENFRPKLKEGDVYIIRNFAVDPNKTTYRVVSDCKIMIRFFWNTYVRAVKAEGSKIIKHKFDFAPYDTLEERRLKPAVLSDVFGLLVNETTEGNVTSIELQNKSKSHIQLKLWGHLSILYTKQKKALGNQCKLFIVIVTSTLVKGKTKASMFLSNTAATKVYFNLDIPKINELKEFFSNDKEEIIVGSLKTEMNVDMIANKKDILTIINHCKTPYVKNMICYCLAEVQEVMSELPWHNPSCPDCNKKPKMGRNDLYCKDCNKPVEKPIIVYRLELLVKDLTGQMILTMFNDEAKRMTKQEASTLYDAHTEQEDDCADDYDHVPSLLRNVFEGKSFLFKIKVDDFNHSNRSKQTFSIMKVLEANKLDEVAQSTTKSPEKRPVENITSDDEDSESSSRPLTFKRLKKKSTSLMVTDVSEE